LHKPSRLHRSHPPIQRFESVWVKPNQANTGTTSAGWLTQSTPLTD